jgi:hypothetical protein
MMSEETAARHWQPMARPRVKVVVSPMALMRPPMNMTATLRHMGSVGVTPAS